MVNRILFWSAFGAATRSLALGIEMRPQFAKSSLVAYPIFMGVGASFGYAMQHVDENQRSKLEGRRQRLMEKRERKAARDAEKAAAAAA
ncbi:putative nadh2 dehydrogenase 14k chain protein [Zalerion maritima]|uniref:Nadh2 dehydrogenase 14k chain protein n=1 Tax=Zalerion maritima TaxID=339359 RepID=A0AAD5RI98_9PEZI|nr:putative nadh2 dehydrogenase 14k chain protein [Zalerion maritima]